GLGVVAGRVGARVTTGGAAVADLGALTERLAEVVRVAVAPLATIRVRGAGRLDAPVPEAGEVLVVAVRVGGARHALRRPVEHHAGGTEGAGNARFAHLRPRLAVQFGGSGDLAGARRGRGGAGNAGAELGRLTLGEVVERVAVAELAAVLREGVRDVHVVRPAVVGPAVGVVALTTRVEGAEGVEELAVLALLAGPQPDEDGAVVEAHAPEVPLDRVRLVAEGPLLGRGRKRLAAELRGVAVVPVRALVVLGVALADLF